MSTRFPCRPWMTSSVSVTGLIYSWQYSVVHIWMLIWFLQENKKKRFQILNNSAHHGGKDMGMKGLREGQWRKEKQEKKDHHKLSIAGRMSVDDDLNFTYRKLLSTRSAIPNWPSASVSRHWACLKHISLARTVVTGLSPRIVANFWLADSCVSL